MTHSKASSAMPDLRALARVAHGLDQKSSSVAATPAQTILRISSKVVCWVKNTLTKESPANATNVMTQFSRGKTWAVEQARRELDLASPERPAISAPGSCIFIYWLEIDGKHTRISGSILLSPRFHC